MGAFFGGCVVAAVVWYVGRKIARMLFAIGVMIEEIGKRSVDNWPPQEHWDATFKG